MKTGIWLAIILVLAIAGTYLLISSEASRTGGVISDGVESDFKSNENNAESQKDTNSAENVKEFNIIARQWEFSPATINVDEGDKVRLIIKSIDVTHGFDLPDFGINENLAPGKTVTLEFVADKKGSFGFFCNIYCGEGHRDMKGVLIVE